MALMAPMMLPSSIWAAARHGRRAVVFLAEYLAVWLAFAVLISVGPWTFGGAWIVAAVALYELGPMKRACLARWRSAHTSGFRHGVDCIGCSGPLMVALLAMGVLNVAWMLIPAAVALLEKSMPGYRSNALFTARRHSLTRRSASSSSSCGS
jgi:predicted metal-binding membrane protein